MSELARGHGGNGGLCFEDHICPACEAGKPCVDLFEHPICGTVACTADETPARIDCRHAGGSADCPATCWLIFGDRFITVVDWDDVEHWGQPGSNVHEAAWAPDGRHDDITEEE